MTVLNTLAVLELKVHVTVTGRQDQNVSQNGYEGLSGRALIYLSLGLL